mgnify:CR=1 FL=1
MRNGLICAVLALSLSLWGCGTDFGASGITRIDGLVLDALDVPVPGIFVAPVYQLQAVAGAPSAAAGGGPALGAPRPNPATAPGPGNRVRITATLPEAATVSVEVWGQVRGGFLRVDLLFQGEWAAGSHEVSWDGDDLTGFPVPNGLYELRLLQPDGTLLAKQNLLVNRSTGALIGEGQTVFVESDGFGRYLLDDLPVGELIQRTDSAGGNLGTARIADGINVFFHDPDGDFFDKTTLVIASVGAVVEHTTRLSATVPGGLANELE